MHSELIRSELLFGHSAIEKLSRSKVIIFGIGGVGGHALETIARSGVGSITIVDADRVEPSNINRQLLALHSTVGRNKTDVAVERVLDINPDCIVKGINMFYLPDNADSINISQYDYVIDCIDTIASKMELIRRSNSYGVRIISSMGAGNRVDATALHVTDIYKTSIDPLAKVVRRRCRELGIGRLKVVCSTETPILHDGDIIASNAFVPASMGIIIGSEVVKDLIDN
ncbi:MAG: tRNA threonylcarbamoyladenosine dehydratase [Prevotella sp.]|nr:tRNA threonylcarbamoyladenosine dehydratase [Prevotella sp.]